VNTLRERVICATFIVYKQNFYQIGAQ